MNDPDLADVDVSLVLGPDDVRVRVSAGLALDQDVLADDGGRRCRVGDEERWIWKETIILIVAEMFEVSKKIQLDNLFFSFNFRPKKYFETHRSLRCRCKYQ